MDSSAGPAGSMPAGSMPAGSMPAGSMPPGSMPPGSMPIDAVTGYPSLTAELRGTALLFGLALLVTVGAATGATILVRALGG